MKKPVTDKRYRDPQDEETVASAVVAHLLSEGRTVADFRRPPTGGVRSPDFLMQLDGSQMALEVVRFLDADLTKAMANIAMVERALKNEVRLQEAAAGLGCKLVLEIHFSVQPLLDYQRADADHDAGLLAASILRGLAVGLDGLEGGVQLLTNVSWVQRADLVAYSSSEPSVYIGSCTPEPSLASLNAAAFLSRTIISKGNQHLAHATTAILAIRSDLDVSAALRGAFAEENQLIPWWRVYNVWSGGSLRVVHSADDRG